MQTVVPGKRRIGQTDQFGTDSQTGERPGPAKKLLRRGATVPKRAGLIPCRFGRGRRRDAEHDIVPANRAETIKRPCTDFTKGDWHVESNERKDQR